MPPPLRSAPRRPSSATSEDGQIAFAAPAISNDDVEAVVRVLRRGWITTGDEAGAFEADVAELTGAPHVVAMSSCTAALESVFAYVDLPPGALIGVPTWTFVASALAPLKHGYRVILLDVDPDTLNVSPSAVQRGVDAGMSGLVVVHFAGVPVERAVLDAAAAAHVTVVEDAAHALGAVDHRGVMAGRGTAGACFSFYATKNVTSAEGGALATDDSGLAEFARSYRLHGLSSDAWARYRPGAKPTYDLVSGGIKANLPDVLAALGRSQLRRFGEMQRQRRLLVTRYRSHLGTLPGVRCVPSGLVEGSADHLMVVLLSDADARAAAIERLAAAGIGSSVHFQPLHTFPWFRQRAMTDPGGLPIADDAAPRALSLPLHPSLHERDVDRVCEVLEASLG